MPHHFYAPAHLVRLVRQLAVQLDDERAHLLKHGAAAACTHPAQSAICAPPCVRAAALHRRWTRSEAQHQQERIIIFLSSLLTTTTSISSIITRGAHRSTLSPALNNDALLHRLVHTGHWVEVAKQ